MSLKDWLKILVPVITLALAGLGGYYDLKSRVAVTESQMTQETRGYYVLQQEISRRLESIERKLDCMNDKRFCR